MSKCFFYLTALAFLIASCMPYYNRVQRKEITFQFKVQIVNSNYDPIKGAEVQLTIEAGASSKSKVIVDTFFTTVSNIVYERTVRVRNETATLYYEVIREGYCSAKGYFRRTEDNPKPDEISKIILQPETFNEVSFAANCIGLSHEKIQNIEVYYTLLKKNKILYRGNGISNEKGIINGALTVSCSDMNDRLDLIIEGGDGDYYQAKDTIRNISKEDGRQYNIDLISRRDYFDQQFILSNNYPLLKDNIIMFIDILRLKSLLTSSLLEFRSINILEFKQKKYLTFDWNHAVEYNSVQLDKYDIGKRVFDEVIRKVLNPLNDNLENSKEFDGYKLRVSTKTRNFAQEDDLGEELIYDFYIPKDIVRSYKNLDITGQQVLDNSIILLGGERIDLKLQ